MSISPLRADSTRVSSGDQPTGKRATVLVVEDSPFFARQVTKLLAPIEDLNISYAETLSAALEAIKRDSPAVILTDLILPDGEGLELVQRVRSEHPKMQVILMTAYGSEEIAMRALRAGAANYIAKKNIATELVPLLRQVLEMAAWTQERAKILRCMVRHESVFVLENDPKLITAFMNLVREELAGLDLWDQTGLIQVSIALQEALINAIYHGNLEVDSEHRQVDERIFDAVAEERRQCDPYRTRKVRIHVQLDRDVARFSVSDDGPGFDTSQVNCEPSAKDLQA